MICVQGYQPWMATIYPLYPMSLAAPTTPATYPPYNSGLMNASYPLAPVDPNPLPTMAGGQPPLPPGVPLRLFTRATQAGTVRTCLVPDRVQYRAGDRFEVVRSQRTNQGALFYLVVRDGCAGWVPADHLAIRRGRGPGREGEDGAGTEDWDGSLDLDISDGDTTENMG
jgi:hypothetical protein